MNTAASIKRLMLISGMTRETAQRIRQLWLTAGEPRLQREAINELCETHGVELLGIHKRAGGYVYYCNAGDTYSTTILFHGSRLTVGCWGDLVERNAVITDSHKIQESFYS